MSTVKTIEKQQEVCEINYRDEPNNPSVDYNADPITNSESFKYKSSIAGKILNANQEDDENTKQGNTKSWKCCSIKTFKQFFEKLRHAFD